MKFKFFHWKILIYILTIFALGCTSSAQAARKRTTSSIVIDALSGEVIASSNADERRYPASLTKLMTLYITFSALEKGDIKPDDQLKISRRAANREHSRLGLKPGETIATVAMFSILIPAEYPARTSLPKLFTTLCTSIMPMDTVDCCSMEGIANVTIFLSTMICFLHRNLPIKAKPITPTIIS